AALLAGGPAQPARAAARGSAEALVSRAIEAVGGQEALKSISSLQIETIGHQYFIDQSERPDGPVRTLYIPTSDEPGVAGGGSRIEAQQRLVGAADWAPDGATIVDADAAATVRGDRLVPSGRQAFDEGRDRIELGPERMLLVALVAPDLAVAPDVTVHG